MSKEVWLDGYYPPSMEGYDNFEHWSAQWSMGPHAEKDWVWITAGHYTEKSAREYLIEHKEDMKKGDEDEQEDSE